MKRPALSGTQHEAIPRHRSTWNLARFARPARSPFIPGASDEPSDNGPGQRQTSSDGPITLISLIRPDATWPDEPILSSTETGSGRI